MAMHCNLARQARSGGLFVIIESHIAHHTILTSSYLYSLFDISYSKLTYEGHVTTVMPCSEVYASFMEMINNCTPHGKVADHGRFQSRDCQSTEIVRLLSVTVCSVEMTCAGYINAAGETRRLEDRVIHLIIEGDKSHSCVWLRSTEAPHTLQHSLLHKL